MQPSYFVDLLDSWYPFKLPKQKQKQKQIICLPHWKAYNKTGIQQDYVEKQQKKCHQDCQVSLQLST